MVGNNLRQTFDSYVQDKSKNPLFLHGDSLQILAELTEETIDFCMTSPPYWGKREYTNGGIGLKMDYHDYIDHLACVFSKVKRVLKPTGSLWLNIGDSYLDKQLLGIPWRLTLKLTDDQGWILRNSVIGNKIKGGPDNTLYHSMLNENITINHK